MYTSKRHDRISKSTTMLFWGQTIISIIRKQNHKGLISLYGNIIIVARIDVMILYLFSTVVIDVLLILHHF